jgi:hypothetical protein
MYGKRGEPNFLAMCIATGAMRKSTATFAMNAERKAATAHRANSAYFSVFMCVRILFAISSGILLSEKMNDTIMKPQMTARTSHCIALNMVSCQEIRPRIIRANSDPTDT